MIANEVIRILFLIVALSGGHVCTCRADYRGDPTPQFAFEADDNSLASHFDFGVAVGNRFSRAIRARFSANSNLQDMLKYTNGTVVIGLKLEAMLEIS